MWIVYAFFSAITAALVTIFAKAGLKNVDVILATTIRAVIMVAVLLLITATLGKFNGFSFKFLDGKDWWLIIAAGIFGALSWLFYFMALKYGLASHVAAIDKLSLVFIIIFSLLFLKESFHWSAILGGLLMVVGAILISIK